LTHEELVGNIKISEYSVLQIEDYHISAYQEVALFSEHRDPFDRFLLATSFSEKIPIITSDEKFMLYPKIQIILNRL